MSLHKMKTIFRPICWIRTIWYSAPTYLVDLIPIMGHHYVEQENGDLVCEVCGHRD